jgi:hypothetical protein
MSTIKYLDVIALLNDYRKMFITSSSKGVLALSGKRRGNEEFVIINVLNETDEGEIHFDDIVFLKSISSGKYLTNRSGSLQCNQDYPDDSAKFRIICTQVSETNVIRSLDVVFLQSITTKKYIVGDLFRYVNCNRNEAKSWEKFQIKYVRKHNPNYKRTIAEKPKGLIAKSQEIVTSHIYIGDSKDNTNPMKMMKSEQSNSSSDIDTTGTVAIGGEDIVLSSKERIDYERGLDKILKDPTRYSSLTRQQKEIAAANLTIKRKLREIYIPDIDNGIDLTVKLIITELHDFNDTIRAIASHFGAALNITSTYGFYHPALTFNDKLIDYNNSSFCVPRIWGGRNTVAAIDVLKVHNHERDKIAQMLDDLADVIVEWNANKIYSQTECNCQHFIDAICNKLAINLNFSGAVGEYVKRLRKTGNATPIYDIKPSLAKILNVKPGIIEFLNHRDVDEFVIKVYNTDSQYFLSKDGASEEVLLKSFCRSYWFRYMKDPENPDATPHDNCPYGDPDKFSMRGNSKRKTLK